MTKKEFLKRCANAYDAGLCTPDRLRLLYRWLDVVGRFEGGQLAYVAEFLNEEKRRLDGFARTLASDNDGYALIQLASILTHPCQQCAVDPQAWWTRSAFCRHGKKGILSQCRSGDDGEGENTECRNEGF